MIRLLRAILLFAAPSVLLPFVLPNIAVAQPAAASAPAQSEHRWHTHRKGALDQLRDLTTADPDDSNPLAEPFSTVKSWLKRADITTDVFLMFFYQWSSDVLFDGQSFASLAYANTGDWQFAKDTTLGDSYLGWTLLGSEGFTFDTKNESSNGGFQIGDASLVNGAIFPNTSALDEFFWKQVIDDERVVLTVGRVDQSFSFDVNRVANDGYRKLMAFVFVNNLSIPFPLYGGVGAAVSWKVNEQLTLALGGGESGSDEPWQFWQTVDDGDWYQLFEADLTLDVPMLGRGTYRITPWHNHLEGEDGWGVGFNFDQELGVPGLVAFLRFGIGESQVTPVDRTVSAGLGLEAPFGRERDYFAIGAGWSRSSAPGTRAETLIEMQYRLSLTKSLEISPDLQIIIHPASNFSKDVIVVPGVRLTMIY